MNRRTTTMSDPLLGQLRAKAYENLDRVGFGHPNAIRKGYDSGWHMLMCRHDDNEAAIFYLTIGNYLSRKQTTILFDNLATQYTDFENFGDYAAACSQMPCNGIPPNPALRHTD
jgi:hypothetical protein